MRYSCDERTGPTLCIRRCSLCASGFLYMHKTVRGARHMNVHARRTPAMRRARWTNARHTRGTRWACVVCSSTEVQRTPSAPWVHTQRASNACPARRAFCWRVPSVCVACTQRVAMGYINTSQPIPSSLLVRPSWVMT